MALVAFLFTDIVGSTASWASHPSAMKVALEQHDRLLVEVVAAAGGSVFKHTGDGSCSVFTSAGDAAAAAASAQRALAAAEWGELGTLSIRMGVHAGDAIARGGDWFGPALNRCARLMDIADGGQILLSGAAHALLEQLPDGLEIRDVGIHRLRDLAEPEHVWQLSGAGLIDVFPPLRSLDSFRGRLPSRLTSFIGRERELRQLRAELTGARLVTLVGPGGMGKTRLALQLATGSMEDFGDGVWFVELAPLAADSTIDHAVATTLGFQSQAGLGIRDLLREGLGSWNALLVLDNCEHVLGPARDLVVDLLGRCDHLAVLATSRAPLRVPGERVRSVGPLDAGTDGAALLADRAAAARPGFALVSDGAAAVTAICEHLDGMPLAIELAAARLRSMTPVELLERLDQRFRLLRADRAGAAAADRHATLRAVVDWSYDLLSADEQRLLGDLGVFAGGFDLAAAHAVRSGGAQTDELDTLDLVDVLVDQSLVQATEAAGRTRYSLLETLRQYIDQQQTVEERRDRSARHGTYFLDVARTADEGLKGREQAAWLRRLELEHDNLRAALAWSLGPDGDQTTALGLGASLGWFWRVRSHIDEGRQWLARVLATPTQPSATTDRTRALIPAGLLDYTLGRNAVGHELVDRAWKDATLMEDGDGLGWALHALGRLALDRKDHDAARAYLTESIEQFERIGDARGSAYSMYHRAAVLGFTGDIAAAERGFADAEQHFRAIGDSWGLVGISTMRGNMATATGRQAIVARNFGESLSHAAALGSAWQACSALFGIARTAARLQRWLIATMLFGAAQAVSESMGSTIERNGGPSAVRLIQEARDALEPKTFDVAWTEGHTLTFEDAVSAGGTAAEELAIPEQPAAAAGDRPPGLTEREWEIARLVARGGSNKQIAADLHLSVRTVENHLSHVYAKLDVGGRSELILAVLEQGSPRR